jgi:hypothetical protein
MTQVTPHTTIFVNLYNALKAKTEEQLAEFHKALQEFETVESILKEWRYKDLLTPAKLKKEWTIEDLKQHLYTKKADKEQKELAKELLHLQTVEKAPDLQSMTISVEWKKSKMWGSNPTAEARVATTDNYQEYYNSGSIGGCGYDKESTAIANAVNQSNAFLKAMYLHKEKNLDKKNHDLFGYGSGYWTLPKLEGGVGKSCYPRIFEAIGYEFKGTASGKSFDVYTVTKKSY